MKSYGKFILGVFSGLIGVLILAGITLYITGFIRL
jgi:hypothetical protein